MVRSAVSWDAVEPTTSVEISWSIFESFDPAGANEDRRGMEEREPCAREGYENEEARERVIQKKKKSDERERGDTTHWEEEEQKKKKKRRQGSCQKFQIIRSSRASYQIQGFWPKRSI